MQDTKLVCRFAAAAALAFGFATGGAAQILLNVIPQEFPPASYTGNQYIDSAGCAFVRAGLSGNVSWVPRVDRNRDLLCGFQPTFSEPPPLDPIPDNVPIIVPVTTTTAPAQTTAPAPATVAAPRPASNVGAPIATVAGLTTPPRIGLPAPTQAPVQTPAVVPMPVSAPLPVAAPAPAATPTLTRAEACVGRFGVQPGFISDRTGQPIDCGPRPTSQPVTVAGDVSVPRVLGPIPAAFPTGGAPSAGLPAPIPAAASASDPFPGVRRATLAEICAEVALTGARFVNAQTGQPIVCAPTTTVAVVQPPLAPAGPMPVGGPAAPGLAAPVAMAGLANAVRTGPQTQSPSGMTSPFVEAPRTLARAPSALEELVSPSPVPASNPVRPLVQHIRPPEGYERVWDDGRINLNRGLAQPSAAQVAPARELSRAPVAATAPQSAPQPVAQAPTQAAVQAPSHRFIQVGTYGEPSNADAAAARLRSLGLPVGFATATRNGQELRIVAAGPFTSAAQLNAALQAVRSAGYGDAFARN